jgi:7-carboxy-7-deazaguanine synthase
MLVVNEIYGPVAQGEGKSAGLKVMFLRLSGCNLACSWCDTPYTWNWIGTHFQHPDKYDKKKEVHRMDYHAVYKQLSGKCSELDNLVISGGEPMLQQKELLPLLNLLSADHWWIEVETNGTIAPLSEFTRLINQYNCSPKLSNAGEIDNPVNKRLKWDSLMKIYYSRKATFKFVIQSNQDLQEMNEIRERVKIEPYDIWLMPEGKTKEEQLARQDLVRELCSRYGYNFSPRLHILEFGNKRAV